MNTSVCLTEGASFMWGIIYNDETADLSYPLMMTLLFFFSIPSLHSFPPSPSLPLLPLSPFPSLPSPLYKRLTLLRLSCCIMGSFWLVKHRERKGHVLSSQGTRASQIDIHGESKTG